MGWYESLFGNLPAQPAHPASRGALFGMNYQGMPDTTAGIEDRRADHLTYLPSRPHDLNWASTNNYNKFDPSGYIANSEIEEARQHAAQSWANTNIPRISTTPIQDPDATPDPSIVAHQKAWEDMMERAYPPNWQGPSLPDGSERGPQFTPQQMQSALQLWQGQ